MWTRVDASVVGDCEPVEVLFYYDGALSFTVKHGDNPCFYFHLGDYEIQYTLFLARQCTTEDIDRLKNNEIPVRDFLVAGPLYVVRHALDQVEMFEVTPEDVLDYLPKEGVTMYPKTPDKVETFELSSKDFLGLISRAQARKH